MNCLRTIRHFSQVGVSFRTSQFLSPLLVSAALFAAGPVFAGSKEASPQWNPQSSEKLVKLPATYLKKSIDSDFAESELGSAIEAAQERSSFKVGSLVDLKDAVENAEGQVKTELRHQLLAEKRAYLQLMSEKNGLHRKQLLTKKRLFEKLLGQLEARNGVNSALKAELINKQQAAQTRFKSTFDKVDVRLFETSAASRSKYAKKYAENMTAIEKLVSRVQNHKMNAAVQSNGKPLTKEEYIRQLLTETEGEIAVLDQEETILGYMAKLVALDALSLSEEALDVELSDSNVPNTSGLAEATNLFLSN